jgi:hypothetical protein
MSIPHECFYYLRLSYQRANAGRVQLLSCQGVWLTYNETWGYTSFDHALPLH